MFAKMAASDHTYENEPTMTLTSVNPISQTALAVSMVLSMSWVNQTND